MHMCVICGVPTEFFMWVRPIAGGRRRFEYLCNEVCRNTREASLAKEGLREANEILGWDVFIPMWERDG